MGTALVIGMLACDGATGPQKQDPASALCGATNITGGSEPSSPQFSCATGDSPTPPADWGVLNGALCLTTGIPAAGLSGAQCTDPSTMTVSVREAGLQYYRAELVAGSLTDPNTLDPFQSCTPATAGQIEVDPQQATAHDSATFTITQKTADFVSGHDVQAPVICSVAITDGHDQQILVNIGMQIFVACANASCVGPASPTPFDIRRRARLPGLRSDDVRDH